jgi:hypothetical protein
MITVTFGVKKHMYKVEDLEKVIKYCKENKILVVDVYPNNIYSPNLGVNGTQALAISAKNAMINIFNDMNNLDPEITTTFKNTL